MASMLTYHVEVRQLLPHELRIYYQFGEKIARKNSDLSKGISGQQTQTGREGSFYKTDSEEGDRKF